MNRSNSDQPNTSAWKIPGWLMAFSQSQFWFYLFTFSIPFLTTSPLQKIPLTTISSGRFLSVIFFMLAITLAKELILGQKRLDRLPKWPVIWLGLFLLLTLAVTAVSASFFAPGLTLDQLRNPYAALGYSFKKLLFYCFVFFFVLAGWLTLDSWDKVKKTVWIYLASTGLVCLYGLILFLAYFQNWRFLMGYSQWKLIRWWIVHPSLPRFIGLAAEPQAFASLLVATLPLTLSLYLWPDQTSFRRGILAVSLFLQSLCLLLTFSASGLAAGLGSFLLVVFLGRRFWVRKYLAYFLVFCLVCPIAVGSFLAVKIPRFLTNLPGYTGKFLTAQNYSHLPRRDIAASDVMSSVMERHWLRQSAWAMFLNHPWLGLGQGGFANNYHPYRPPGSINYSLPPRVHNQYFEVLTETGLIGFTTLGLFFWSLANLLRRRIRDRDQTAFPLVVGLLAAFFGFALQGFYFGVFQHVYFWLAVILLVAIALPNSDSAQTS